MNDIHIKGLPSPQRMVFASGESPPSEWDSPARRFLPFPGGSLLQVNDIHLKGLPLSTANGIRFRGVPSSKRMVFSSRGFPLHSEWDSLQRIPLVNSEWNSHYLRNPLQEIGIRITRVTLSKATWIRRSLPLADWVLTGGAIRASRRVAPQPPSWGGCRN